MEASSGAFTHLPSGRSVTPGRTECASAIWGIFKTTARDTDNR